MWYRVVNMAMLFFQVISWVVLTRAVRTCNQCKDLPTISTVYLFYMIFVHVFCAIMSNKLFRVRVITCTCAWYLLLVQNLWYIIQAVDVLATPKASFTKGVNPWLAKRPLVLNGRLGNRGLTSLVKEVTWVRASAVMFSTIFAFDIVYLFDWTSSYPTRTYRAGWHLLKCQARSSQTQMN